MSVAVDFVSTVARPRSHAVEQQSHRPAGDVAGEGDQRVGVQGAGRGAGARVMARRRYRAPRWPRRHPPPAPAVDLRSDTVTRPTPAMRRAMAEAEVGDDGFGDDPTVHRAPGALRRARPGKEAALFVPSGTMANQIALRVLARRRHAGRGRAAPARRDPRGRRVRRSTRSAQLHLLDDDDGTLDPADVAHLVDGRRPPLAGARRWCASRTPTWPRAAGPGRSTRLAAVAAVGVPVHLDGARAVQRRGGHRHHRGRPLGRRPRTVTACLSKGLGAPVGSLLAGPADLIDRARVERKRLGGGMRQVGILAAAGLVALDTMVDRLADDHARARRPGRGGGRALARRRLRPRGGRTPTSCCSATTTRSRLLDALAERGRRRGDARAGHGAARHPLRHRRRRARAVAVAGPSATAP